MKRSDKIKARKRIENGCNFPEFMTSRKFIGSPLGFYYNW